MGSEPENSELTRQELLLLEDYKIAADLYARDADRYWVRYDVFLGLNTAMLAAFALLLDRLILFPPIGVAFGVLGTVSCMVWFFVSAAGTANFIYWPKRAYEISRVIPELQTLSELRLEQHFDNHRWFNRVIVTRVSYSIPIVFTGVWIALAIWILIGGLH